MHLPKFLIFFIIRSALLAQHDFKLKLFSDSTLFLQGYGKTW